MSTRETWGSRAGFVLAAVGSAIGLGNIWRFPYIAFKNGGGAFLIPYIFALLTAGIPFMILEFGLGHKFRGSAPKTFASISKKWEWLGWLQIGITFVIGIYYVAVIGWAISYTFFSLTQAWGNAPKDFFFNQYLHLSSSPLELGSIQTGILITTLMAWIITWGCVAYGGAERSRKNQQDIHAPAFLYGSAHYWAHPDIRWGDEWSPVAVQTRLFQNYGLPCMDRCLRANLLHTEHRLFHYDYVCQLSA